MNVFETHAKIVGDYASYIRSFINIDDLGIRRAVDAALAEGKLWPEPLLQFNPSYEMVGRVAEIAQTGVLHGAVNAGTMIPAGMVERGERKQTVDEVSKAD
jgi:hypothetical protein